MAPGRVVAYKMGTEVTKKLVTTPIRTILKQPDKPTIIHSDMGSQYASALFEDALLNAGIKQSHSRQGCPGG